MDARPPLPVPALAKPWKVPARLPREQDAKFLCPPREVSTLPVAPLPGPARRLPRRTVVHWFDYRARRGRSQSKDIERQETICGLPTTAPKLPLAPQTRAKDSTCSARSACRLLDVEIERAAAAEAACSALGHPALAVPAGAKRYRELPVVVRLEDGTIVDGRIDCAWSDGERWTVIDYKTDRREQRNVAQVQLYGLALQRATGRLGCVESCSKSDSRSSTNV